MNKYGVPFLIIIFFILLSCENNKNKAKNDSINDSITTELSSKQKDSAALKLPLNKVESGVADKNAQSFLNGSNLKIENYIKQYPTNQKAALKRHIEWLRKEWQNAPNPITAIYKGNDFGDYHHIVFKAANGVQYDFGQAKNSFGQYKLYDLSGQYNDNLEFLGKKFKIYWDWKLSEFLCCEGEYGEAKAYLPSIVKLELIKD